MGGDDHQTSETTPRNQQPTRRTNPETGSDLEPTNEASEEKDRPQNNVRRIAKFAAPDDIDVTRREKSPDEGTDTGAKD